MQGLRWCEVVDGPTTETRSIQSKMKRLNNGQFRYAPVVDGQRNQGEVQANFRTDGVPV